MANARPNELQGYEPRDPRTAEPQPPFPPQSQESPGSEERMEPRPDHGAQPAEIAPGFVLLACDESRYVSGEIVGATRGRPTM